jgi:hypothetical protein
MEREGTNSFTALKNLSVTGPIFMKPTLVRKKVFVKNIYTIFYENLAACSFADTRSQTDRHGLHKLPSCLTSEMPPKIGRFVPLNVAVQVPAVTTDFQVLNLLKCVQILKQCKDVMGRGI